MNKKVALSVLSATVFASMAASAFAAPKSGLYIGGNVDKYYSMDTLFKMNSATSDRFSNELVQAGFSNLIYVDFDGKGASISEIMAAPDFEGAKKDLTADKFEGEYANIGTDGTANGSYDPRKDTPDVGGELKVESVSAI
ncbi:sugar-binding domain protein, partial [Brevibacillus choshinensis]|nr:sugar-binding domain protein [Brevibacillus choshinensis]